MAGDISSVAMFFKWLHFYSPCHVMFRLAFSKEMNGWVGYQPFYPHPSQTRSSLWGVALLLCTLWASHHQQYHHYLQTSIFHFEGQSFPPSQDPRQLRSIWKQASANLMKNYCDLFLTPKFLFAYSSPTATPISTIVGKFFSLLKSSESSPYK